MRISDWSSDVCSSDLPTLFAAAAVRRAACRLHPSSACDTNIPWVRLGLKPASKKSGCFGAIFTLFTVRAGGIDNGYEKGAGRRRCAPKENGRVCVCVLGKRGRSEEHTSELQSLMRNS